MVNVLFVTHEQKRKDFLSHLLGEDCFIIICDGQQDIDSLLPLVELVLVDFSSLRWQGLDVVSVAKKSNSSKLVLGIGRQVEKEIVNSAKKKGLAEYIDVDKNIGALPQMVREKIEKKMLNSHIKEKDSVSHFSNSSYTEKREQGFSSEEGDFFEEMSRFLAHGYNLNELLHFFLNFLSKVFGITRLCILLKQEGQEGNDVYKIKACLGLSRQVKEHIQLIPQRGLAKFLAMEGTVVTRENFPEVGFKTAYQIKQDMKLISSHVAIPISPQGRLIGILGVGPKITGERFLSGEIKQLFLFCNQIGLAIQNLLFYKEMSYQKKYTDNILRNASSGVLSINNEHQIITCNPRAKKMLNLDKRGLTGKDIRELASPLGDFLFEALTKGTHYERKEVYVPALKRWLGISTSQMRDTRGEVMGSMMIFTDLTPIKHLQEEKKKLQKRNFLSQVSLRLSHELRNRFVPIKSLVELLPSKYMDEEFQKRLFSVVTQEVERIDELIERLVFFSQPLQLDKVAGSVSQLLNEAVNKAKSRVTTGQDVQFNIDCKQDNLQVYVDRNTVIEALTHILANSIEATGNEPVSIDIHCESVNELPSNAVPPKAEEKVAPFGFSGYVKIEVKDYGPGLPVEDGANIFDPFFTTKNKGIGLGLTISQTAIEEHGGSIVPVSEKGKGTAMVVYLPRYVPPA